MRLLLPRFRQLLEDALRGFLPRRFLRKTLCPAGPFLAHPHLDCKCLGMFRTFFVDDKVARGRQLQRLRHFLKGALIIRHRAVDAALGDHEGPHHVRFNKGTRRVDSGLQ